LFYTRMSNQTISNGVTNGVANGFPKNIINGFANGSHFVNGSAIKTITTTLQQPLLIKQNASVNFSKNNIPLVIKSNYVSSTITKNSIASSTATSGYFNSLFVNKNNVSTISAASKIIKSDESGQSPAKIPKLEYGPQLPPNLKTESLNTIISTLQTKVLNETTPSNGVHNGEKDEYQLETIKSKKKD